MINIEAGGINMSPDEQKQFVLRYAQLVLKELENPLNEAEIEEKEEIKKKTNLSEEQLIEKGKEELLR